MHARTHEVREGHTAKRVRAFARGGRRFRANGAARTEGSCQRERSTGMEEKGRARRELGEGGGGKRERERERDGRWWKKGRKRWNCGRRRKVENEVFEQLVLIARASFFFFYHFFVQKKSVFIRSS